MRQFILYLLMTTLAFGEDRIVGALTERALAEQVLRLKTDDRISLYETLAHAQVENPHYKVLLAGAFIQKMRETTDFSYVERASRLLNMVFAADSANYEALRLASEIELERHHFTKVVELSQRLIGVAPEDPWNWGTMGDAYTELGDYDRAAEAYQKMVNLRPDLASYNRAAHFRFLNDDVPGAIEIMQRAINSGSASAENTAWCLVDLGNIYAKTGQMDDAERAFVNALRTFPNYHPAFAGLGKIQAARGKTKAAIESYERAQAITPLPDYAAALYDLYTADGQQMLAEKQNALIQIIDKTMQANGEKVNRNLSLIYSDHDWSLDRALELARAEFDLRRDIYTYDALAWALYKNRKYEEAEKAMQKALILHTPEPMFQYHASKIAKALGRGGN